MKSNLSSIIVFLTFFYICESQNSSTATNRQQVRPIFLGGLCWSSVTEDGLCYSLIKAFVTQKDCCSDGRPNTGFSSDSVEPGRLFYLKALRRGVPCKRCKNSCDGVKCSPNKVCTIKQGIGPKCVCKVNCTRRKRKLGKVCGLDGKTYKNICHLMRHKCRQNDDAIILDYYGSCKDSCDQVTCGDGSNCLVDQNNRPHCIPCPRNCPPVVSDEKICGANNRTYSSICELRKESCLSGKNILILRRGKCSSSDDNIF